MPFDALRLRPGAHLRGRFGRHHAHAPAGLQQAGDLRFTYGSRSDDEARPRRKLQKHGEKLCRFHAFTRRAPRCSVNTKSKGNRTCNCTYEQAVNAGNSILRETIGSQESGHFEDAMIVVALSELRRCGVVDDESHVRMKLKGGGGDRGRDRAFDGLCDGGRLGLACGEQKNFPRLQNRADAHGDGTARTLLTRRKELRVVVQCFLAQDLQARAGADAGSRLVEADVAVAPDAQKLKVDSSCLSDSLLVRCAVLIVIAADGSVGNVDVSGIRVDVREEVFLHEMMKAPRMCGGKSEIFIEIKGNDAREIERALFVQMHEMFVDADHGAAGCQSKHQRRFFAHRAGNELRGLEADFFVVAFQDNQHAASSLNCAFPNAKETRQSYRNLRMTRLCRS